MPETITSLIEKLEGAEGQGRFWAKVQKGREDECWPWTGYCGGRGYGIYRFGKRAVARAHRIAYTLSKGTIPDGILVCHTCDNPPCCNPAHLWLGTDADNNRDRACKGRTVSPFGASYTGPRPHGEKHGSARLTQQQALEILSRTEKGSVLAREYGVDETTISRVRRGKTWPHLRAQSEARV